MRNLVRFLRAEKPDIIVSFLWFINMTTILARRLSGVPSRLIVSERSTIEGSREGLVTEAVRRGAIALLYPAADRSVANSRELARQLVEGFGLPRRKVCVIPNPLDLDEIVPMGTRADGQDDGPDAAPVVAGMGRMSREKGFDLLIRAIPHVRARFSLVLIGEGPEKARLRELAGREGVLDRVTLAGFLRDPYPVLAKARVFVLPSRYEGFPNGLVEAMALGLPCIATRCPTGPEEIITDGEDGLLVPVDDPKSLAAALDRLLGDAALRDRLGRAAKERVREYDARTIVPRFEELIDEVRG